MYVATINTPGYLPDVEPATFDTPEQAWSYLADERSDALSDLGQYDDAAVRAMRDAAHNVRRSQDVRMTHAVVTSTPGADPDRDLGLVYEVTEV